MSAPSIPGVHRDDLADAIRGYIDSGFGPFGITSAGLADAALAYIADHHECACDREHADEWVEVDEATWADLPVGTRTRREWVVGAYDVRRCFVHRDDLPDPDADLIERMAKAIHASYYPNDRWEGWSEDLQGYYRKIARTALAASREGER